MSNPNTESNAAQADREPASRTALAALLAGVVLELSAVRAAYHVAVSLLARREREICELRGRYVALIEESRKHRQTRAA